MNSYYAYTGKLSLLESKLKNINYLTFKTNNKEMAFKICRRKFLDKEFKLFQFENFNNLVTYKEITKEE